MGRRYMSIWFRHLLTDRYTLKLPALADKPLVIVEKQHNRMVIIAANALAEQNNIKPGMVSTDAKAQEPYLEVQDAIEGLNVRLLKVLGLWCLRYTPIVAIDLPDGLVLDISGCTHLWGGEKKYLKEIVNRLRGKGYDARAAIADTIGAAWGHARYGRVTPIIALNDHRRVIGSLPPAALRLDDATLDKLQKLGLYTIHSFIDIQASALRRRFGPQLLTRLYQALGQVDESLQPIRPVEPYQVRLPCLEPVRTAAAIEIAIKKLLEMLCQRLEKEGKGLRTGILKSYRVDGRMQQLQIGTNKASCQVNHLFKLFELNIVKIAPGLGIEMFILEAPNVELLEQDQETIWETQENKAANNAIAELLDRITGKLGQGTVTRFLPQEQHWPERSVKYAQTLQEQPETEWRTDKRRPTLLLAKPEPVQVSAPVPDYPPILFVHNGKRHDVKKADGPERIEREWWQDDGEHRDYYVVEDTLGQRYWLYRSGHYDARRTGQWFLHGYFA